MRELPVGVVTFLFTDIEGSTRLVKQLGDRYGSVLGDHHRLLRSVFTEHGGSEVGTHGDAFFVAFARAGDAVAAAVAAQLALTAHQWQDGVELRVRMGMHTGEAEVASDDYVGLSVHRAARICAIGHGGQILISNATRELIQDDLPREVILRDIGEHRLKDFDRPERLFQALVDGLPGQLLAPKSSARDGGFVGRELELEELLAALEDALAGRGRVVLVTGEPGIGKSRLVDEFGERARARGARVLPARCWEAGGAPAYWPWVQSIRAYLRDVPQESALADVATGARYLSQMLPELREIFPELPSASPDDPEGARFQLFDSVATLLRKAAMRRPLVIVVEDLHAADASSLLLLEFIGGAVADAAVLVIGTYREEEMERGDPLARAVAQLTRLPVTRRLALLGLSLEEVQQLMGLMSAEAGGPAAAGALHRETEGNPLFVGEVVRLLAAEGGLAQLGVGAPARIAVPESVREVISRRLGRLSPNCISALTIASVLGREFALDALELVSELDADALLDVLDEAMGARVVAEVPGTLGRLRFAHALIREALYEELAPLRRGRLHRRVGEALEGLYGESSEPHLAELAYHFFEAAPGEFDKATAYTLRAGNRAATLTAYEEAARLYRMGLLLADRREPSDQELRIDLLLRLGDAEARAGEAALARATFLVAAETARDLGQPERLAQAALGYGGRFVWDAARGDRHLVLLLEEALEVLPEESTPLRARLLARLGGGPLRDDVDSTRREALTKAAEEIARHLGDPATLAYVLDGRYAARWGPDVDLEERLRASTELVEVAIAAGDRERTLQGHHYRALCLLELGDVTGVYAELEAKRRIVDELRQPSQRWYLEAVLPTMATLEGRFDEAEQLLAAALRSGERAYGSHAVVTSHFHLYALRHQQGRLEELEETIRRSADEFPSYRVLRCMLAHLYAELGREDEARREFEGLATHDFESLPRNDEWVFGMSLLADVAGFLVDPIRAETIYRLLLPYATWSAVSAPDACIGAVARSLGVAAATAGRPDDAERHFEEALKVNARMGARPWLARTQCDYARALVERGRPGDSEHAAELVGAAVTSARELRIPYLIERAEALQPSLGPP